MWVVFTIINIKARQTRRVAILDALFSTKCLAICVRVSFRREIDINETLMLIMCRRNLLEVFRQFFVSIFFNYDCSPTTYLHLRECFQVVLWWRQTWWIFLHQCLGCGNVIFVALCRTKYVDRLEASSILTYFSTFP